jgi:hypothetical protein
MVTREIVTRTPDVSTDIHVHDRGVTKVVMSNGTLWLDVPLSTDGTARITVFLDPTHALRLAESLLFLAKRAQQIETLSQAENGDMP